LPDGVEQVFGHAGAFEHQPHEGEERYRQERIVAHHHVDAHRQRLQEIRLELAKPDAEQSVKQADKRQRKCGRIAEQQHDHQRAEHDRRQIMDEKRFHCSSGSRRRF
jgi:hypothetical protein